MQKKKLLAGVTALAIAAVIIPSSYAFGGFGGPKDGGKNFDPEKHEAVMEALESQDYDAFVEATGKTNLTEERFEKIIERFEKNSEKREEGKAQHEAIKAAVEAGDYEAWKALIEEKNPDAPILDIITADNLAQFQELHEALESGDFETVKTISNELGLKKGFGAKRHLGKAGKRGGRGMKFGQFKNQN